MDKLEHTSIFDEVVLPTSTETGLTKEKHCAVCEEVLIKQEVVSATGKHIWKNKTGFACAGEKDSFFSCQKEIAVL